MDLGVWEVMFSEEIDAKYSSGLSERRREPFHTRTQNGESPHDVARRGLTVNHEIVNKHPDESIAIISHSIMLAVTIFHAEGFRIEDVYQHILVNAQPRHVQWSQHSLNPWI